MPATPRPQATLITQVAVIDGTGAPAFDADVVLEGGLITQVVRAPAASPDPLTREAAGPERVIDGTGLALAPGFIDMHAHSDLQILLEPDHLAKLSQGVTTEVLGQDGLSYAPIDDTVLGVVRQKIAGWNDDPHDRPIGWPTVRAYLDELDAAGIATNVAYLVPHGVIRALVVGFGEGAATPEQIERMAALVEAAMLDGAAGLSAGLTYTPGMYADRAELLALLRVVARHGGFFSPHTRSYGRGALEAYAEMIELARDSGAALHLTHATMNFGENAGRAADFLALVDAALADGVDLTLDTYPYLPGATTLSAVLPSWASAGDTDQTLARFADPDLRARLRLDMDVRGSDGCHGVVVDYGTLEISGVRHSHLEALVGRTVLEIARERGEDPFDTALWIMTEDRLGTGILQHVGHEENVRAILTHRAHTGGSDGILVGAKPHPRAWGTFPRFLGHYVRAEGLMGLEEMVHHLTGRPAARLGLLDAASLPDAGTSSDAASPLGAAAPAAAPAGAAPSAAPGRVTAQRAAPPRGLVRVGYAADLVLFDPARVDAANSFDRPRIPAAGIERVWVNGTLAYARGAVTGHRAGRALRHASPQTQPASPGPMHTTVHPEPPETEDPWTA